MDKVQQILRKRRRFSVSGDHKQRLAWLFAAMGLGITVPKFLERAGDVYARHLAWVKIRREDKAMRDSDKAFHEARRRR